MYTSKKTLDELREIVKELEVMLKNVDPNNKELKEELEKSIFKTLEDISYFVSLEKTEL